jgi:hypothetical protein
MEMEDGDLRYGNGKTDVFPQRRKDAKEQRKKICRELNE